MLYRTDKYGNQLSRLGFGCMRLPQTAEGKIDFEELKTSLATDVAEDTIEKYEFTWVGKNAAKAEANRPIRKTLRPVVADSKDWDNTKNLYIEGDNLDALKLLQESYLGKVKMIYIDPPYNTGFNLIYHNDAHRCHCRLYRRCHFPRCQGRRRGD